MLENLTFQKGAGKNILEYPLDQKQLDNLDTCNLVNPCIGEDYGLKIPDDFNIEDAADEVLHARLQVLNNEFPWELAEKYWPYKFKMPRTLPKAFKLNNLSFDNPQGMANIVHMDDPLDLPLSLKKVFTNPKYGGFANIKEGWVPDYKQFIETVVDVNHVITEYQSKYIRKAFKFKYDKGIPRPEEIKNKLKELLTAYEEGSPNHPSILQGHLTLSQSGFKALYDSLDLKSYQVKDGLYTSYLWGFFRVLAGVHYVIDGILSILLVGGFDKYIKPDILKKYKNDCRIAKRY